MSVSDYAVFLFSAPGAWRYFEKVVPAARMPSCRATGCWRELPVSPFALPLARWMVASVEFGFSFAVVALDFSARERRWTVHVIDPAAGRPAMGHGRAGCGSVLRDAVHVLPRRAPAGADDADVRVLHGAHPVQARIVPAGSVQARLLAGHPLTYLAALFQKPIYAGRWPGPRDWAVYQRDARAARRSAWERGIGRAARLYLYV